MDILPFCVLMMFTVSVITCLDRNLDDRWPESFKTGNKKKYMIDDKAKRRAIWEAKIREIEQHNREADLGDHSYWMRETEWDDMTFNEFFYPDKYLDQTVNYTLLKCPGHDFNKNKSPVSRDWTKEGYVTSVKQQNSQPGNCGACWAFAAIGSIEGQVYKNKNQLANLSMQSVVDCSTSNKGCFGGYPSTAFNDFMKLPGIATEESYPYTGKDEPCQLSSANLVARIDGCRSIRTDEELLNAVAFVGPVTVALQTGTKFQNFGEGIFTDCTGPLNHVVLVVGYGTYSDKKVWKIKNSHSNRWGDNGYFYLSREKVNPCMINSYGSYPIVSDTANRTDASHFTSSADVVSRMSLLIFILPLWLSVHDINII